MIGDRKRNETYEGRRGCGLNTRVVRVDKDNPDKTVLQEVGEVIKKGGLAAFPTETVYGLGGDGLNAGSSQKIYAAKGRPSDNPLIIHIADMESLAQITEDVPEKAKNWQKNSGQGL